MTQTKCGEEISFSQPCLSPHPTCVCVCVCVWGGGGGGVGGWVCIVSVTVKCPVLTPCVVDRHSKNPRYYYLEAGRVTC